MTHERTNEELSRKIAGALGYHEAEDYFPVSDRTGYSLSDKDGNAVGHGFNYWAKGEAWVECPDWPSDAGAALVLCLEIALANNSEVGIMPYIDGTFVADFTDAKTDEYIVHADGTTPALALSNLALAALKAQAVTDA